MWLSIFTHQSLEFMRVVWEATVVCVRLGSHHPEEHIREQDTDFGGTCKKKITLFEGPTVIKHRHLCAPRVVLRFKDSAGSIQRAALLEVR